jgi:hypothetical protein
MTHSSAPQSHLPAQQRRHHRLPRRALLAAFSFMICTLLNGCAALTNPVGEGYPVRHLPPELLGSPKEDLQTIPLTLLRQPPPDAYRLAPGDVLGIYIEGILPATVVGQTPPTPPVYLPGQVSPLGRRLPPAVGFPFTIQDDGTIALPQLGPLKISDMTLPEVQAAIAKAYIDAKILPAGRERILVSLMQQRQYRVLVFRQEAGGTAGVGGLLAASSTKRGIGQVVDLPAYENDVLSALSQTGGLPGLDTYNEVIVFRDGQRSRTLVPGLERLPRRGDPLALAAPLSEVVRIPLRTLPGQPLPIQSQDILLNNGDVVFLEARDTDVFYTGGLLPTGEHVLPRDYDLTVVKAIAFIKGPLVNSFGGSGLSGTLVEQGVGNPVPSLLTVLRKTPGGGQVPIRVDLNRALRDPRENIRVQAGDVLILQEQPSEAVTRYVTRTLVNFRMTWQAIHSRFVSGTLDVTAPERAGGGAVIVP